MQRDPDGNLHGWCWNEAAPTTRQTVEILIDGAVIATLVAARFREDVRQAGIGDGYHGFLVSLARTLANGATDRIISARERSSGIMFGRLVPPDVGFPVALQRRLRHVAHTLAQAQEAIGRQDAARLQARRDRLATWHNLGTHLAARGEAGWHAALPAKLAVPVVRAPLYSIVAVPSDDAGATLARIKRAAPALAQSEAELLLIDSGHDPAMALLPGAVAGLRYFNGRGQGAGATLNRVAAQAQGATTLLLELGDTDIGPGLAGFAETGSICIGAGMADAARRFQPDLAAAIAVKHAPAWLGLQLALPRGILEKLGGFDPAINDSAGLCVLDFVLRALRDGHSVVEWRDPARPHAPEPGMALNATRQAWRAFAANWRLAA